MSRRAGKSGNARAVAADGRASRRVPAGPGDASAGDAPRARAGGPRPENQVPVLRYGLAEDPSDYDDEYLRNSWQEKQDAAAGAHGTLDPRRARRA